MLQEYYTCKNDATSLFANVRQATTAILSELTSSEPQSMSDLATAIGETLPIVRSALITMLERMEVLSTYSGAWFRISTVRSAFDPLGPKAQALYDFIHTNPGSTTAEIATGGSYPLDLVTHILYTLKYTHDVFVEHVGPNGHYGTIELAWIQLTNAKLLTAYNDILAHEGTTLPAAALRLYPSLSPEKGQALTQKVYRCLMRAKGLHFAP